MMQMMEANGKLGYNFKESPPKQEQQKLLARSGSDPQFDNLAYLKKIEDQTLAALKGMGIPTDDVH